MPARDARFRNRLLQRLQPALRFLSKLRNHARLLDVSMGFGTNCARFHCNRKLGSARATTAFREIGSLARRRARCPPAEWPTGTGARSRCLLAALSPATTTANVPGHPPPKTCAKLGHADGGDSALSFLAETPQAAYPRPVATRAETLPRAEYAFPRRSRPALFRTPTRRWPGRDLHSPVPGFLSARRSWIGADQKPA